VLRHSIYTDDEQTGIGDLLIRRKGDSVEMNCDVVAGIPAPVIMWSKNGADIVLNATTDASNRNGDAGRRLVVDGQRLTVGGLRPSDGGLYRCTAKNVVGQDEQVFRLVIEGE
jgi:hypothetical protein